MAQRTVKTCLALVLVTVMWTGTWAQPNPNCMPAITSLSPCVGFITGNSSTPSASCCSQLASVVQTQAQCLCTVLNGAPQLPFVVNQTQALTLPGACKIQTPPVSQCKAASGSPAPAPAPASETPSVAAAPAPSTPSVATPSVPTGAAAPKTPSAPSVPSASGGSKKSPATTGVSPTSASSSTTFTLPLVFFFAAASVFSSF